MGSRTATLDWYDRLEEYCAANVNCIDHLRSWTEGWNYANHAAVFILFAALNKRQKGTSIQAEYQSRVKKFDA